VQLLLASLVAAQPDRIARIENDRRVVLNGYVTRQVRPEYDRGRVDGSRRISGISLVLKRSAKQQEELEKLLTDQRDPSSLSYQEWLTPEEFADRFGMSQGDIDRITGWLTSEGFAIDRVARARNSITFSGTAGQVERTFRTEMHNYLVEGKMHYANQSEPAIPEALAPTVLAINGLNNLPVLRPKMSMTLMPKYNSSNGNHYLAPADFAAIYDIAPLYAKGIDGSGQKLAVVGRTNVNNTDVNLFRSDNQLPAGGFQKVLVDGSDDPGIVDSDFIEANLDIDWTMAIAPKATILYVYATNVYDSVAYTIDQNLAPVMSMSYGLCEGAFKVPADAGAFFQSYAQQANAQGMTWIAASGDAGAADCDPTSSKVAKYGLGVDLPAAVPEVTGVGGTEFNEGSGNYWNSNNGGNRLSALGYIPERAWNDPGGQLSASGGGASTLFSKPKWQTGPGVPNDRMRDVPDVSFTASAAHDGYCIAMNGQILCGAGGTSAAAPVFAGMVTLVNQYQVASGAQAKPGMGNINPKLYSMAQANPGIFHDITVGDNMVPCTAGTPDCNGPTIGYRTGAGYDQVTGLGSTDVYRLVTQWGGTSGGSSGESTTTSVSATPATIAANDSTMLTATVKSVGGTATPTGTVSFTAGSKTLRTANLAGSAGTATASVTIAGSQLSSGTNTIAAVYAGNTGFNPSSGSTDVLVNGAGTTAPALASAVPNPVYQQAPDSDGYGWFFSLKITDVSGLSSTVTGFTIDGTDYSSSIASWFGSTTLPAYDTLATGIRSNFNNVPETHVFAFSGMNANGAKWVQQVAVEFRGKATSGAIALSSSPAVVRAQPESDTGCDKGYPFYQVLSVQETSGYPIVLNKFLAGGNDFSSDLAGWFGTSKLPADGTLRTAICWQLDGPFPETVDYEVDGTDSAGNKVSATVSVEFLSGPDLGHPNLRMFDKQPEPGIKTAARAAKPTVR
jgi:subtilase family serine protease